MTDSGSVTRVLFEDFTPSAVRLFYAIGYSAIAVFVYGCYVQVRKYRRGAPNRRPVLRVRSSRDPACPQRGPGRFS